MDVTASEVDAIPTTALSHLGGGQSERAEWLPQVLQWAGFMALPMGAYWRTVAFFGKIRIRYKCPVFAGRISIDTTPVTGVTSLCRLLDIALLICVCRVIRLDCF